MKRKPSPATVIASVALFFSLAGTGLAAQHFLITSLSQFAPKVRHELRGQRGPAGPTGPQGPQGQQGPQGVSGSADEITVFGSQADLTSLADSEQSVAWCPSGYRAISGGYAGNNVLVVTSEITTAVGGVTGWVVVGQYVHQPSDWPQLPSWVFAEANCSPS